MASKKKNDGLGLGLISKSDIKNVNSMESSLNNLSVTFGKLVTQMSSVVTELSKISKGFNNINKASNNSINTVAKQIKETRQQINTEVTKRLSRKDVINANKLAKEFGDKPLGGGIVQLSIEGTIKRNELEKKQIEAQYWKDVTKAAKEQAKKSAEILESQTEINKLLLADDYAAKAFVNHQISQNDLEAEKNILLSQSKEYLDSFVSTQTSSLHLVIEQSKALRNSAEYVAEMVNNQIESNLSQVAQTNALAKSEKYISSVLEKEKANAKLQKQIEKSRYAQLPAIQKTSIWLNKVGTALRGNKNYAAEFTSSMQSIVTQFITINSLGQLLYDVKESVGDWVENMNLFNVSFGKTSRDTYEWAMDFSDSLGTSKNETIEMLGLFREMTGSIGLKNVSLQVKELTGDVDELGNSIERIVELNLSDEMSKLFTSISYDISSLFNVEPDDVADALQSGIISGQIRTMRKFGVDISQEAVQSLLSSNEALKQFDASAENMSQTQKVLARTIITLQAIGNLTAGDMARTITSLANRQRVFEAQLSNLKITIGIITEKYFANLYAYLIAIVRVINETLQEMFGVSDMLKDVANVDSSGVENATDNVNDLNDATKNYQKTLGNFSFDKFEVLSGGSSSGESENEQLTQELAKLYHEQQKAYEDQLDEVSATDEKVQSIYEKLRENGGISGAIKNIVSLVKEIRPLAVEILSIIGNISPTIINIYVDLLKFVVQVIKLLEKLNLIKPLIYAIFSAKIIGSVLSPIGSALIGFGQLLDVFKKIKELGMIKIFKGIGTTLGVIALTLMAIDVLRFFSDNTVSVTKKIAAALVGVAAAVVTTVAAIKMIGMDVAGAIRVGLFAALAGTLVTAQLMGNGFEDGGIPEKSELFYMNEYGRPEALVNTGGTKTNVINIDQLSEGMRRGFVAAIKETGLAEGNKLIVEGRNIDNNTVARGLFNSLIIESKRRGGNKL